MYIIQTRSDIKSFLLTKHYCLQLRSKEKLSTFKSLLYNCGMQSWREQINNIGIINLPQQWKLHEKSPLIHFDSVMETHGACGSSLKGTPPLWFCIWDKWRQTLARTQLWRIRLLNLLSLNYMTICAMVFFRFFMRTRMTFFPENDNMIHRYFCIVMLHPNLPYESEYRQIKNQTILTLKFDENSIAMHSGGRWDTLIKYIVNTTLDTLIKDIANTCTYITHNIQYLLWPAK
mgnify:FL=1